MAQVTLTAAQVGRAHPGTDEVYSFIATEAITIGQAVYQLTTGKFGVADANVAAKDQGRGVALNDAGAGQPVAVMLRGWLTGFDVSALDADTFVYLSDTAGEIADAAGTLEVRLGRVMGTSEIDSSGNVTKLIYIDSNLKTDWS